MPQIDSLHPAYKFMYEYGCFTSFWSNFDILMDVAICKLSGQDPKNYCLSKKMTSGDKKKELEKYLNDPVVLSKLQAVFDVAERNDWIHGHILNPNKDFSRLTRLRIDSKNKKVTNEIIDYSGSHFEKFYSAYGEFQAAIAVTDDECNAYITAIQT
jgi:hypothetical protein